MSYLAPMNMETEGLTFTHENAAAYAQVELTGLYLYAARLIRTKLGPLNGKLNTVVDFGCGAGKSTRAIAKWLNPDGTLIGVDISASMLEHAQRLNHEARPQLPEVNFNYKQIENGIIPLATASVDAVTSSLVLQEVQSERELEEILLEIGRVTKPGGEFIAVVPNDHLRSEDFVTITYTPFPENLTRTDNIRKCKLKDSPIIWEKDRHWSKEIYSRLAEKAGFQILAFEYPLADPTHPPFPSTPEIPWKDELKTSPAMLMHAIKIP